HGAAGPTPSAGRARCSPPAACAGPARPGTAPRPAPAPGPRRPRPAAPARLPLPVRSPPDCPRPWCDRRYAGRMVCVIADEIRFGPQVCGDLAAGSAREWLLTDGRGGYAMGTVSGLRTRRYHGLLVEIGRAHV